MGTSNAALQKFLQDRNPQLTKEASAQAISEIEDSFIKAATASGVSASELLKIASDTPETWNQLVNNYVSDLVITAEKQAQAAEFQKQAEAEHMAKVAEDIASGQRIAHAMMDELNKIAQEMYKAAEEEEKKEDEKKEEKKDEGHGVPPALQEAMKADEKHEEKKEEMKEDEKTGALLPLEVEVHRKAIMLKHANRLPISDPEVEFLSLCKLAESGVTVDWSQVK